MAEKAFGGRIGEMRGCERLSKIRKSLNVEPLDEAFRRMDHNMVVGRIGGRRSSRCDVAACAVAGPRIACLRMTGFVRKIL